MKIIKLMSLFIRDFKGIATLDIDFGGHDAVISGRNGEGKTSVYDALCWLLTGKDARGNQPESEGFNIKPRDNAGNVLSGVMPTVTAKLDVNGEKITFKKVYKEKWEKPRGATEARFAGHTTEHFVDDIPRKEIEYKRIVGELIDEDAFQMLTDVYRFPAKLKWQERRKLLFDLCGVQDDASIMAVNARFAPLATAVGRWTVDEYKQSLKSRRRAVNGTLEMLPIRIDEVEKSVAGLRDMDFAQIDADIAQLEDHKRAMEAELYDITHNAALIGAKNALVSLRNELDKLENDNAAHRRSQEVLVVDPRPAMQRELDTLRAAQKCERDAVSAAQTQIQMANMRLDDYRTEWRKISKEAYAGKDTCPTCGQTLPADKVQQAKDRFERDKKDRLDRLKKDSDVLKQGIADQEKTASEHQDEADRLDQQAQELADKLAATAAPEAPVIEDLPGYIKQSAELLDAIRQAEAKVQQLSDDSDARVRDVKAQIIDTDAKLSGLRSELAKEGNIKAAAQRVEELRADQRAQAAELEKIDSLIYLCEEFARYKVESITEEINGRFQRASFRLFREQINGGLEDCCDVMMDGRPYGSLSDGEKIKIGLDIVQTLSEYYGVKVPLFVDRAESVTEFPEVDTQVIRLMVDDKDMEVCCETER